jgi:endoglucanase
MANTELLKKLTDASGVPGYEGEVRAVIREALSGQARVETDVSGNIYGWKPGTSDRPRIMLPGHMDEVGFMVKSIDDKGFLRFSPLGGWWDHVLLAQEVLVCASKGKVPGVIGSKPPHFLNADERKKMMEKKDMFIDVGAKDNADAEEKLGIRVGYPIVPNFALKPLKNERLVLAKAWDDRIGCALFIDVIKALQSMNHPNTVVGVGTVQEEVGLRGATTASFTVQPDVALVMDVGLANDVPGSKPEDGAGELGKGPQICVLDARMIPNLKLRDLAVSVAKENEIPLQFTMLEGGATDGGPIHLFREGVPTLYIGVPTRYVHAHSGILHLDDYDAAVRLVTQLVLRLDGPTVASLKPE